MGEPKAVAESVEEVLRGVRRTIRKLLDLPFTVLCLDHGPPVTNDPKTAVSALPAS